MGRKDIKIIKSFKCGLKFNMKGDRKWIKSMELSSHLEIKMR